MRHAAGELADRFHLLSLAQLFLAIAPLGQVAGDLGETQQISAWFADRGDHHTRPEQAAILAHPPAFGREFAVAQCHFQHSLRHAVAPIAVRVEAREMLADNLLGQVALDAPRAGIPIDDVPLGIEHENRIIGHRLHQ